MPHSPLNIEQVDNYLVGVHLGSGSYGDIYAGKHKHNLDPVAIKFERKSKHRATVRDEKNFYRRLRDANMDGINGIPKYYGFFDLPRHYALVVEMLGPSLEDIHKKSGYKFSVRATIQVAVQCIKLLKSVHSVGIVYRDIKPDNFLLGIEGSPKASKIHVVDFGLSKMYMVGGEHREVTTHRGLTGTARYMSLTAHQGYEQSRRDDLQALAHMLLYLVLGRLPWQGMQAHVDRTRRAQNKPGSGTHEELCDFIYRKKRRTRPEELCEGLPGVFEYFVKHTRQLHYIETPPYSNYITRFENEAKEMGFNPDSKIIWTEREDISEPDQPMPFENSTASNAKTRGSDIGRQINSEE